jgi:putative addiction module component (TIGR02574 family)
LPVALLECIEQSTNRTYLPHFISSQRFSRKLYNPARYNDRMSRTLEEVSQLALELPYEDRAKLSRWLWETLHPPGEDLPQEEIDAAWDAEIERRLGEIDSGEVELISHEEFIADLDAHIAGKR